jgi:hypothetical protein
MTTVDSNLIQPTTSLAWAGIPGVLSFDPLAALDRYYDKMPIDTDVAQQDWSVNEKQTIGFARFGIDTALGNDAGARQCRRPVRAREPGGRRQGGQQRHHHRPAAAAPPTTTSCPA